MVTHDDKKYRLIFGVVLCWVYLGGGRYILVGDYWWWVVVSIFWEVVGSGWWWWVYFGKWWVVMEFSLGGGFILRSGGW